MDGKSIQLVPKVIVLQLDVNNDPLSYEESFSSAIQFIPKSSNELVMIGDEEVTSLSL